MRAADLFKLPVLDVDGVRRGIVIDIRAKAEDGGLVVDGFVVGTHTGGFFGYERRREQGPALLSALIWRLHRGSRYLPWDDAELDENAGVVRLRRQWADLPKLHEIPG
jgi:hypothetical protein